MAHPVFPVRFGRGLSLAAAPELMADGQCRVLENWRTLGNGRITTRKAPLSYTNLGGEPVKAIIPYTGLPDVAAVALTFGEGGESDIGGDVNLWTISGHGSAIKVGSLAGLWDGQVYESVRVHAAVVNTIVFIVDEDRKFGLTVWDPNFFLGGEDQFGPAAFFQPTFVFSEAPPGPDESAESTPPPESGESVITAKPMKPSFVLEHLNHLWVFGYGSDIDPDRPEYGRFSYLGLVADDHGKGDAGYWGVPGSLNLFDVEDVVPIANRGENVVGASSAPGRMIVCTDNEPYAIYGQDFSSWRKDKLDTHRGLVNSLAIGEADGATWWFSPLGLCRFAGGGVEDVTQRSDDQGASVRPLLNEIDFDSVLFGHAFAEQQVRFYYRRKDDTRSGCDRALIVDYQASTYLADRHVFRDGGRVACVGMLRPSGLEKPAGLPLTLEHGRIGAHTATAVWSPGDMMPGVRTTVRLVSPGGTRDVAVLEGGASRFTHTGLSPSTLYSTEIEQTRNQQSVGSKRASFTTLAETGVLPLENVELRQTSYLAPSDKLQFVLQPMLDLTWRLPEPGLTAVVERSTDGATFSELARLAGDTIYHDKAVTEGTRYYYRLKASDRSGNETAYSATLDAIAVVTQPASGIGSGLPGEGASSGIDTDTSSTNE